MEYWIAVAFVEAVTAAAEPDSANVMFVANQSHF